MCFHSFIHSFIQYLLSSALCQMQPWTEQPCFEERKEGGAVRPCEDADLTCLERHCLPGLALSGCRCVEGTFNDEDCAHSLRSFLCVLRKELHQGRSAWRSRLVSAGRLLTSRSLERLELMNVASVAGLQGQSGSGTLAASHLPWYLQLPPFPEDLQKHCLLAGGVSCSVPGFLSPPPQILSAN